MSILLKRHVITQILQTFEEDTDAQGHCFPFPPLSPFTEFCGVKNKDHLCICRRKVSDPGIICYCFYC